MNEEEKKFDPKEERKDEKKGKKSRKPGRRGGRRDEDQKNRMFTELASETSSAVTAVKALKGAKVNTGLEDELRVLPYAVQHVWIRLGDMAQDYMDNHGKDIARALKHAAAQYFSSVSAYTLADMEEKFNTVVTNSLTVFALICWLRKCQNRAQLLDEDKRPMNKLLNNFHNTISSMDIKDIDDANILGEWSITNSQYAKEILAKLKNCYITPEMADLLYTLVGNAIQLREGDDATVRYIDFVPQNVLESSLTSYASFKAHLDALEAQIKAAYESYAFFADLFEALGLVPDKLGKFNFTRSLAQDEFDCLIDDGNNIYDLVYACTCNGGNYNDTVDESSSSSFCIVSASEFEAFRTAETGLYIIDRVQISINTLMNALRGNIGPVNTSFLRLETSDGVSVSTAYKEINPYYIWYDVNSGLDANHMLAVNYANIYTAFLDMPVSGASVFVHTCSDYTIQNRTYSHFWGVSDYVLPASNIEGIISDAAYATIFSGRIDKFNKSVAYPQDINGNSYGDR